MKRFYFDDSEEEEEEEEGDFDEDNLDSQFFSMAPISISENTIISNCIKLCENYIFWKFLSLETKLNKIKKAYDFIKELEKENEE